MHHAGKPRHTDITACGPGAQQANFTERCASAVEAIVNCPRCHFGTREQTVALFINRVMARTNTVIAQPPRLDAFGLVTQRRNKLNNGIVIHRLTRQKTPTALRNKLFNTIGNDEHSPRRNLQHLRTPFDQPIASFRARQMV